MKNLVKTKISGNYYKLDQKTKIYKKHTFLQTPITYTLLLVGSFKRFYYDLRVYKSVAICD